MRKTVEHGAHHPQPDSNTGPLAKEAAALLSAIVESSDDAIVSKTLEGIVTSWNRAAEHLFGYRADEMIGKSITTIIPPERLDEERQILERLRRGEILDHFETVRVRKDGRRVDVSLTVSPVRDQAGALIGASKIARDISERKATERRIGQLTAELRDRTDEMEQVRSRTASLEESHRRLRHSERMATLGSLSAGLGHDLGNLLMPVRVRIETLQRMNLPADALREIESIQVAADYLQRLSNGLRLMSRDASRAAAADVTEIRGWWDDASSVFRSILPRGVTLESIIPDGETWASISRAALTQAIFNLVQNSCEAAKATAEGRIVVQARVEGDEVTVSVSDNGTGMSTEVQDRCMEPFFTTKPRDISTGMGLVLVDGLIRGAGGHVSLRSEQGRGTVVTVHLRRAFPSAPARVPDHGGARLRAAVVDLKDARLSAFVTAELGRNGYAILRGINAEPAPDLIVADDPGVAARFGIAPATRTILLADPTGAEPPAVTALGCRPRWLEVRRVLEEAAHAGVPGNGASNG